MKNILVLVSMTIIFTSCQKSTPTPEPTQEGRNVLAYFVADNNLASYAFADVNEMESAWDDNYNGKMFVFFNKKGGESQLLQIKHDKDPEKINSIVIKTYPKTQDPCDVTFFRSVVDEVHKLYPAKNRGLILWSHGSGWLKQGSRYPLKSGEKLSKLDYVLSDENDDRQRTIGSADSHGSEMEIYDIAKALDGVKFDFISFDACYMACVEVYYELKERANYIFASAAETLADGAPYDQITGMMFEKEINMPKIAETCFQYFNKESGVRKSSTYSVVKTDKLEALAITVKNITKSNNPNSISVQQFGRSPFNNIFFDLEDFIIKNYGPNEEFTAALKNAVVYKNATPMLFNQIVVNSHCGLTNYIPRQEQPNTLKIYKERYSWSKDSGLGELF